MPDSGCRRDSHCRQQVFSLPADGNDSGRWERGDEAVPDLRVGLATGLVIARMGDVFGTTVNLASRLTSLARPASALVDVATAEDLAGDPIELLCGGERYLARLARSFVEVRPSDIMVLVDSYGQIAVAVNTGSAEEVLGLTPGDLVELRRLS